MGIERKCHLLAEEEAQEEKERTLTAYGLPLYQVTSFKYMGRVLAEEKYNWPSVLHNLRRAIHKWAQMTRILIREGVDAQIPGKI